MADKKTAADEPNDAPKPSQPSAADTASAWSAAAWLALRRLFRSDLQQERALDSERKELMAARPPVEDALAQDYAAWRRSLLWIACVALATVGILEALLYESQAEQIERATRTALEARGDTNAAEQARHSAEQIANSIGRENLEILDGIFAILIFPMLIGAVLCAIAARRWCDLRTSRRRARLAFLINFLTPFCLAIFPVKEMMDYQQMTPAARQAMTAVLGIQMGLYYFMLIGPRSIALFPGVIRSSMTIKTLLPESPMPGWAVALAAPLYTVFLLVIFTTVNQMYGNFLLLTGIACLVLAPLVFLRRRKSLLRPHTAEEVSAVVGRLRRSAGLANLLGVVFLGAFLFDVEFMRVGDVIKFALSIVGNVVLLTVVGADFMLALLYAGHEQAHALHESKLEASLESRFEGLEEAGLTALRPTARAPGKEA